jgi:NADH-ubiquinone oxidoreductase chain 5
MYLLPLYFTLAGFLFSFFLGRFLNNYYVGFFTSILVLLSFIVSLSIFYEVVLCKSPTFIDCGNWITTGLLEIKWIFAFDSTTSIMLLVILGVSTCSHFYSIEYMLTDPHQIKFMSYLSLFTFFMLCLVTSSNFIILFLGWEGVGICSYLLINFWSTRLGANKSAIMAVFVNKIGDVSLLIGFTLLFILFHSFDFSIIFSSMAITLYTDVADLNLNSSKIIYLISSLFIVGAVGKSAQLGLHMWLPEAMEGPTPVSSLIHAATMVTAGIFLIIRSNVMFQWCNDLATVIVFIGSSTAFLGSTIGVFQSDVKKIIAYSTCSQLGYMFLACGLNGYSYSFYHLTNHAFFKALLFLVAGYIIHAVDNEQDIRKLGGLYKILPFAYVGINIGSLSLLGFPFFSGYFSKEKIIELFYNVSFESIDMCMNNFKTLTFFSLLSTVSITFTVLYSIKILVYVFFYLFQNNHNKIIQLHYSSSVTLYPLFFLSILSIASGYLLEDLMVGISTNSWNYSMYYDPYEYDTLNSNFFEFNLLSSKLPILSILYFMILFFLYYYMLERKLFYLKISNNTINFLYLFFNKKYLVFNKNIIYPSIDILFRFSLNSMYTLFDKGLIEILGPFGINKSINSIAYNNARLNNGLVYGYIGQMNMGIILLILFIFII